MQSLLKQIDALSPTKQHPVIFLCGLGGTGKTTLAYDLKRQRSCVVIETDWYLTYATKERRARIQEAIDTGDMKEIESKENPLHWYNWDQFLADVEFLQKNGHLHIHGAWNQKTGEKDLEITIQFQGDNDLIVCDGIYLLHSPLRERADLIVLLEADKERSTERARKRDAHRSSPGYLAYKTELLEKYDWPYFQKYKDNADLVVRDFVL